jgi:short-subunit dehydrogenase
LAVEDLSSVNGATKLYADALALGLPIDILLNNAGFGGHGKNVDRDLSDELSMIDLMQSLCEFFPPSRRTCLRHDDAGQADHH